MANEIDDDSDIVNCKNRCYHLYMFDLESLKRYLSSMGISRFFFKQLSENDNSKNQVYLGGSFDVLQKFSFGSVSMKRGLKRPVYNAPMEFWWIDDNGNTARAPGAQLILYPKYPEVRLSGFLRGCPTAPSQYFKEVPESRRTGKQDGRVLVFAPLGERTYAYLAVPGSRLSAELQSVSYSGVFGEIETQPGSTKDALIGLLRKAWMENPHELVRMYPDGSIRPYTSRNAGGYTLEAFFGIKPNGLPVPDFKGWELKSLSGNVATLMTPQPDGGIYHEIQNDEFVRKFGHVSADGRLYFTGKYTSIYPTNDRFLFVKGFDSASGKITDEDGYVGLVQNDLLLASWSFPHLIGHWNSKHNQACYVRYKKVGDCKIEYDPEVLLCERTNAVMFLQAIANGFVYFDPACRVSKARNQFRTSFSKLFALYGVSERLDVSLLV